MDDIKKIIPENATLDHSFNKNNNTLTNVKFSREIPNDIIKQLRLLQDVEKIMVVSPILPIISGNETKVPFTTIESLLKYAKQENLSLGRIGLSMKNA